MNSASREWSEKQKKFMSDSPKRICVKIIVYGPMEVDGDEGFLIYFSVQCTQFPRWLESCLNGRKGRGSRTRILCKIMKCFFLAGFSNDWKDGRKVSSV